MRVVLAIGLLCSANLAAAAEVRLRPAANCGSSVVRLADVADIEAADPALARALAEIPLCPAPSGTSERTLSQHAVRQLLAQSGVERDDLRVTGSDRVTIAAGTQRAAAAATRPAAGVRQAAFESPTAKKPAQPPAVAAADKPAAAVPLVERGASVNVYARAPGVRIATSGKALQTGAAGESILVELADSKDKVQARVVAAQTVEVAVPGNNGGMR